LANYKPNDEDEKDVEKDEEELEKEEDESEEDEPGEYESKVVVDTKIGLNGRDKKKPAKRSGSDQL
jgi:hypothetical protein